MTIIISRDTRIEAWMSACEYLFNNTPSLNVILDIKNPMNDGELGKLANSIVDEYYEKINQYSLHTIAETIFPGWEYKNSGIKFLEKAYADETFPHLKKGKPSAWGTYAYRILRQIKPDGTNMNPLIELIKSINTEKATKGPKHACYELGLSEGALELPLYLTTVDFTRHMGGPCLSHLSFKLWDGAIHLTALYRSHDYSLKVLGNLLGLARLMSCVATETKSNVGSLVVHSTYATIPNPSQIKKIISRIHTSVSKG